MIRTKEATGKTVEEARKKACEMLGVDPDELNVSYEVLEMPQKTGFLGLKMTPARVRVMVEEEERPAPVAVPAAPAPVKKAEPKPEVKAEPKAEKKPEPKQEKPAPKEEPKKAEPAPAPAPVKAEAPAAPVAEEPAAPAEPTEQPAAPDENVEIPLVIEDSPKLTAAVSYLKEIIALMGVEKAEFSAVQKGEATIIRIDGEKMGVLIGRRGETMESLSYLASLVANRMEGDYMKLGLDVAGYREKRESDLTALAQRIGEKVRRTGRSFAIEPMNPYERRIIHSAISQMEGVRSESKGEGRDRRVVIYSTAPDAQTENSYERRPRSGGRTNYRNDRSGSGRSGSGRGGYNNNRSGYRGNRDSSRQNSGYRQNNSYRGDRSGRNSGVPERNYVARDAEAATPTAPKRTERVDDYADLSFGKIDL